MEAKTYKNLTSISQLGIPPGETGERKISEDKEARMVARGAIEIIGTPAETAPEKSEEEKAAEAKAAEEQKAAEDKKAADEAAQQAQAAGGRAGKVR